MGPSCCVSGRDWERCTAAQGTVRCGTARFRELALTRRPLKRGVETVVAPEEFVAGKKARRPENAARDCLVRLRLEALLVRGFVRAREKRRRVEAEGRKNFREHCFVGN